MLIEKAKIALTRDEGLRATPYDDRTGQPLSTLPSGGKVTVGVGWNLSDNGLPASMIEELLEASIENAIAGVVSIFGKSFFYDLSENRQVALITLVFNLGEYKFRQFAHTIAAVKAQDWATAEKELRESYWFHEVGGRAERVIAMLCHDQFPYAEG